jgi:hypothetical protein
MNTSVDDAREFVAETREDGIARAASFFRVSPDQLDVWVVPDTVTVSGLGSNVLVIAALRSERPAAREERRPERRPEQRTERRDERPARPERTERPEPRTERAEPTQRREPRAQADRAAAPRAAPVEDSAEELEDGELGPVGEFIAGILERMKLTAVAVTETETEAGDIIITLDGKAVTALNEREPRFAAALSHLAHRAAEMLVDEEAAARVDIRGAARPPSDERAERSGRDGRGGGTRSDRPDTRRDSDDRDRDIDEVALERMAREAAEIVRRSGSPELLRPMNSRERWVVHNTLKDETGVRSESEGDGPRKRVRITPA